TMITRFAQDKGEKMSDQNQQPPLANSETQQKSTHPEGPQAPCRKCGALIPKYGDKCPLCGAMQKPFYKRVWFWVLVLLVVVLFAMGSCVGSCSQAVSESGNSITSSDGAPVPADSGTEEAAKTDGKTASGKSQEKYTLSDEALVDKGYGMYGVSGVFTNVTDKGIGYVQISYSLLDAEGAQVGTVFANTSNLGAGAVWKYEAIGSASGDAAVVSFKVAKVSGF
ncbi:MAG: FxLYD domain-containing protein, partial [Raoultibacter sp.]